MGSLNILPIDIPEHTFEIEEGVQFDPSKLDYDCPGKEKIAKAVVKMIDFSNANLVKNVDGVLAKRNVDQ